MKLRITMKDPDCLYESIEEAANTYATSLGMPADETEAIAEMKKEKLNDACGHWFEYGEYLTVEIDTDQMTCEVVPRNKP